MPTFGLVKFLTKLVWNQPKKAYTLGKLKLQGDEALGEYLGKELVDVLKVLKPDIQAIIDVLISSDQATSIDELYETVNPMLDRVLDTNIGDYGVSLKELDLHELLTESYLKRDLLPIFITFRDIPKFCKSIKEKNFLKVIQDAKTQLLTHLETDLHGEVRRQLLVGTDGTYEIKPDDPAIVSQIKKILNAFAYAEKVIVFINSLDLNPDTGFKLEAVLEKKGEKQVEFLTKIIWYLAMKDSVVGNYLHFTLDLNQDELKFIHEIEQAIQYVRKAQSSLLEVDIPTAQIFGAELKTLDGVIGSLQKMSVGESSGLWLDKLSTAGGVAQAAGEHVGKPLGAFVEHLKPSSGRKDFSFLTTHLGLLPGYLDELTRLIYAYGAGQPDKQLALSEADTEVFKDSAIKLFFELSNLDNLFFWQKASSYLFPIRSDVVTLSQGAYQQTMRVNEATGEMVAYQLSKIKTEFFTQIISESDKLELYLGLAPGVLTKPLMLGLNDLYQTLVTYANYVVDLKEKYPDLLQLDNASFLNKRLQNTLQQKNECQLHLDRAQKAKQNLKTFVSRFAISKTPEERARLKILYQSFKSYVIEYNPRLSVFLDNYFQSTEPTGEGISEDILKAMSRAVRNLCDKEIATFGCYVKLAESRLAELPKQVKGKLYPLSIQKHHSFLVINELSWLADNSSLTKEQREDLDLERPFVDDLTSLTPQNRSDLYDYHSIRVLTLKYIYQEIDTFLEQLKTDWSLNQKSINSIIERYRVLQPYFVDSLAATSLNDTDTLFVGLLDKLSNAAKKPKEYDLIVDAVNAQMQGLKQNITGEIKKSESRQLIFEVAHHQVREKKLVFFNDAPLRLDSELVQRQDKWIRHQRLSRASTDMKNVLLKLLTQFDPSLKLSATPTSSSNDVPFPEMEQDLTALATPAQVSWAKRMLNVIHYIDSNFRYLESLDRDISQKDITHYFLKGPLIEGLYQIKPFLELTKAYQTLMELMQEPTGQVLFDSLNSAYSHLLGAWETVQPLYFTPSETVHAVKPEPVKSSGLWYPVLSLMVLPEHLEHLSSGQAYKPADAEKTQKKAKELAQYIEKVTEQFQASQYFHLLMKSPYIIFKLMPQLKAQMDKLFATTNTVTVTHLQDIKATLQSILIETDALELKFGLRVGLISKPTKLIIDKLFNSFIEPLSISLVESTQLVQDVSSFKERAQVNRQKQKEVKEMLESEKKVFLSLDQFLKTLEGIKAKLDAKQAIPASEKESFKALYWSVYPLLQSQQSHYQLSLDQRDKSVLLDEFCNECFNEQLQIAASKEGVYHYTPLHDVMYLALRVHAAKKGNINSLEMRASYLNVQAQSIASAKQQFLKAEAKEALDACINNTFNVQVDLLCKKTNQLIYLESEYKAILLKSLLSKKDEILKKVSGLPVKDLEKAISQELQKQFEVFSHKEYLQLLHLDSILAEIKRFQSYCQNEKANPTYENTDPVIGTLRPKIELLNKLNEVAQNDKESPEKRIETLKSEAKKDSFYTILMSHDKRFKFELKTLKRAFLNLFHSIFNFFGMTYRPSDFYTSLDNTIKSDSTSFSKSASKKPGFFSQRQDKLSENSKDTDPVLSEHHKKPSVP